MNARYLLPILFLGACAHRSPAGRNPSAVSFSEIECVPDYRLNRSAVTDAGIDPKDIAKLGSVKEKFRQVTAFKSLSLYMDADPKSPRVIFDHTLEDPTDCADIEGQFNPPSNMDLRQCETKGSLLNKMSRAHSDFDRYQLNIFLTDATKATRSKHGSLQKFQGSLELGDSSIYVLSCFHHQLAKN